MSQAESLNVAVWNGDSFPHESIELCRFTLHGANYETLMEWNRQKTGRRHGGLWLSGLKESLACLVPDVAFMSDSKADAGLRLYFLGSQRGTSEHALEKALFVWIDTLYGKDPARSDRIRQISEAAHDRRNWESYQVSTGLRQHSGACADPNDNLLFDALTAHGVAAIASRELRFTGGDTKTLIAQTPDSNLYHGAELVAPLGGEIEADHGRARGDQVAGDRRAHDADADDADFHSLAPLSTSGAKLAFAPASTPLTARRTIAVKSSATRL